MPPAAAPPRRQRAASQAAVGRRAASDRRELLVTTSKPRHSKPVTRARKPRSSNLWDGRRTQRINLAATASQAQVPRRQPAAAAALLAAASQARHRQAPPAAVAPAVGARDGRLSALPLAPGVAARAAAPLSRSSMLVTLTLPERRWLPQPRCHCGVSISACRCYAVGSITSACIGRGRACQRAEHQEKPGKGAQATRLRGRRRLRRCSARSCPWPPPCAAWRHCGSDWSRASRRSCSARGQGWQLPPAWG